MKFDHFCRFRSLISSSRQNESVIICWKQMLDIKFDSSLVKKNLKLNFVLFCCIFIKICLHVWRFEDVGLLMLKKSFFFKKIRFIDATPLFYTICVRNLKINEWELRWIKLKEIFNWILNCWEFKLLLSNKIKNYFIKYLWWWNQSVNDSMIIKCKFYLEIKLLFRQDFKRLLYRVQLLFRLSS